VSDQDVAQLTSDVETALTANPVPPHSASPPGSVTASF
jgi:hypothetical protein